MLSERAGACQIERRGLFWNLYSKQNYPPLKISRLQVEEDRTGSKEIQQHPNAMTVCR